MSFALIDGDIVAYRASVTAQEDVDWGDGEEGPTVSVSAALSNARSMIEKWLEASGCDTPVICMSPREGDVFRHDLGDYKAGRPDKPEAYWPVVDMLEEDYTVKRIPRLEADDVMGIMATSPKFRDPVIVSIDKDLKTIPGRLLNPTKDEKPRVISPLEADRYWMFQTLTGDIVDGYKGCPGIGKVKAERALAGAKNLKAMWRQVTALFADAGLSLKDALTQARFARILRREDYDKEKETITLWHPNKSRRETLALRS